MASPTPALPSIPANATSTEAPAQTLAPLGDIITDDTANNQITDSSVFEHPEKRQRRQRVLVDMHNQTGRGAQGCASPENEYERERLERIKRNEEMMRDMGLREMAVELATTTDSTAGGGSAPRQRAPPRPRRAPRPRPRVPARRTRHSSRVEALSNPEGDDLVKSEATREAEGGIIKEAAEIEKQEDALLEQEEYFKMIGKDISDAIRTDGFYTGWVCPRMAERCGIAGDADTAWEAGGGGKFSFKIDKKSIPAAVKAKGWSTAKANAYTMLKKNPNCYFYRHVAPGEQQAQGDWNEEEHSAFLRTAREHGVGDKWGLFASHIPQRIGYQCSSYYREVIIPQGYVIDPRFRLTRTGKAVFVG